MLILGVALAVAGSIMSVASIRPTKHTGRPEGSALLAWRRKKKIPIGFFWSKNVFQGVAFKINKQEEISMQMKKWLIVAGIVWAAPALAMQPASVEYSADSYFESADGIQEGSVYSAQGKERREFVQDGMKSVMIMRHDKKVVWMLQPEEKTYMEIKIPKEGRKDDLSAYKFDQTTMGPETVNGVKTTKSKIIMTGPKGAKLGGLYWKSKEGIVVKMDAIAVDKNSKERLKSELKNLKVGRQDASLFEIPADYTKMDMSMGGLGKMMMDGDDKDDDKPPPPQEKGKKKGFGWKDAVDLLK